MSPKALTHVRLDVRFDVQTDERTGVEFLTIEVPTIYEDCSEHWIALQEAYGFSYQEMEEVACFANKLSASKYIASRLRI